MLEFVAGIVVAVAALAVVLEPLVRRVPAESAPAVPELDLTDVEESGSPKVRALLALKEIEFDRATGKLSDEDYAALKSKYSRQALAAIEQEKVGDAAGVALDDPAEAAVQRLRKSGSTNCPACGPRPEAGAIFCSACGRSLVAADASPRCWKCGASLAEGAKFCSSCGGQIAA